MNIILTTSKRRKTLKIIRNIYLHKQKILTSDVGKSATERITYTLYALNFNHTNLNRTRRPIRRRTSILEILID